MSALASLLDIYRNASVTEREKGTYFEELICTYLRNEAKYRDLYEQVWTYSDWAKEQGQDGRDIGIDLVARTQGTKEFHAIQCKLYSQNYRVQKGDIDSFLAASGQKPFTHSILVATTNNWSENADNSLLNRHQTINKIDLQALEDSQIDWAQYKPNQVAVLKAKKSLRDHQKRALLSVTSGLQGTDRGKLIMACGTGKTFTSLKIAEQLAGAGKRVLFLVPSLSLLSQTLTEWTQESETPLHSFAVCSDSDVGKKRKKDDDAVQTFTHELRYPATTEPDKLAAEMLKRHDDQHMSVVFSTYHSIGVINDAQHLYGLGDFDLIVCDEAHRTTGATFGDDDESAFVKVHSADFIRSSKRLYMTATPRIYGDMAKASAEKDNVALCSMDDITLYGKELFVITFSEAVKAELLVDYKVLVLAMDEKHISSRLQKLLADDDNQIKLEDAAKIIGCWKALSKQDTREDLIDDGDPMRRAVAFCQVIDYQKFAKTHKVSSKNIASMFDQVVEAYKASNPENADTAATLICEASHVDGGMTASQKEAELDWLKAEVPDNTCRILSNVRCLSEGVDVPALDAVLFLTPRNSQVDVVQSVGRVMRKAEGKKRGYVILPVVIPSNMAPEEALNDNKTYKVVWQVLQALRSHDDRFDAMVNKLDLIGSDPAKMEIIAVTEKLNKKSDRSNTGKDNGKDTYGIGTGGKYDPGPAPEQFGLEFEIGEIERAIYAKVVQKCGNRSHWEDWAKDIAQIARTHITRITSIIEDEANTREREAFFSFAGELRDDLNDSIGDSEVIEMLAQHLITKPVFDALFEGYSFASSNPMSCAMQNVLDVLQEHRLDKEADTLQRFYDSVKMRAEGIDNAEGKQKIIVELYNNFFEKAFPLLKDKLGIVYTPVEVVDFIIHSVNDILQSEFGQTLGSDGVHIIDPFTGTGTFITRLLQSGLISREQLQNKYQGQIHANEIVLLAYYIAAINIEAVYHGIVGGEYQPFTGICLTDTFQLYEKNDLVSEILVDNSARRTRQKALDIRVIIGNPPYSSGDKEDNNNKNVKYPILDSRISDTYIYKSAEKMGKSKLYDSYIRAIRWASDRIGDSGVIGFVTNAGFTDSNSADGLRKCLADEFSSVHVFHLRGNQRTSGELSRKEGGKIFGGGSRAPIAISLLVKNPSAKQHGQIHWHNIGDYLSQAEKLDKIKSFKSIAGITAADAWQSITPDEHGDWVNQRDNSFAEFVVLGDKKNEKTKKIFETYSMGVKSNRDDWVYNSSKIQLEKNIAKMIEFYNGEVTRYHCDAHSDASAEQFVSRDKTKIKWTTDILGELEKGNKHSIQKESLIFSLYRPFSKQWIFSSKSWNWTRHLMPRIFPDATAKNMAICVTGQGATKGFCAFITDTLPDLEVISKGQCFPLYLYDSPQGQAKANKAALGLFDTPVQSNASTRRDAITDEGLAHFCAVYPGEVISKEDLFYYVYGLLHSPEYREKYADNLSKELPRIPAVKTADFWAFSKAGRTLANLHLSYETVPMYPANVQSSASSESDYRVTKMKYGKKGKDKDLSTLHYNAKITVTGIPLQAYDYIVNGKPALDWVVERQCVSTDKDSGITNDANDWATETMDNPKYPLELFLRVVTVSLETMKIVKALPPLNI